MKNIGGTLMMKTSSDTYYQAGKLGSVRHRPDNPEAVRLHSLELNLNSARGNSLPSQSLNAGGEL